VQKGGEGMGRDGGGMEREGRGREGMGGERGGELHAVHLGCHLGWQQL